MTAQDNTALIQKVYEAFGRGDLQTIMSHLAPDVEWSLEGPASIPYSGKRIGSDQVRGFFEALGTTQTGQRLTIDEYIAQGDRVATTGRYSAVVKATGKRIDCEVMHVFTVQDGRITRLLDFADTAHMADAYLSASAASQ